jgi:hypothetical protein
MLNEAKWRASIIHDKSLVTKLLFGNSRFEKLQLFGEVLASFYYQSEASWIENSQSGETVREFRKLSLQRLSSTSTGAWEFSGSQDRIYWIDRVANECRIICGRMMKHRLKYHSLEQPRRGEMIIAKNDNPNNQTPKGWQDKLALGEIQKKVYDRHLEGDGYVYWDLKSILKSHLKIFRSKNQKWKCPPLLSRSKIRTENCSRNFCKAKSELKMPPETFGSKNQNLKCLPKLSRAKIRIENASQSFRKQEIRLVLRKITLEKNSATNIQNPWQLLKKFIHSNKKNWTTTRWIPTFLISKNAIPIAWISILFSMKFILD